MNEARHAAHLEVAQVRRLALARAGLLAPELTGLPARAAGQGRRGRERAHAVIDRFGYLQLDSVPVSGARTHGIVLASRLSGFDATFAETLLGAGEPLFEYWGHEACWMPLALYPAFEFRRTAYRVHPWWGDVLGEHRRLADDLLRRIEQEGALRSVDLEGRSGQGMWQTKLTSKVAEALWSAGRLAVAERRGFLRSFDLVERVIPDAVRETRIPTEQAFELLLLKALDGHGWATTGTLAATWRLRNCRPDIDAALAALVESGQILPCGLRLGPRVISGWIRTEHLELIDALMRLRPRRDRGVLLS
ncbi:MAG: winged helix DNA-binding domain-containing protein, partial [Gammaproteobacteria bacterium]|nr:winged helix DNA-binding domain-containing protein [Gammaproteobacteria bacterium]